MSCNACLFWASYNFILWYYYCSLLLLSLFISEFEIWSIMYCSVFILFLLVVFSLSLNFWNSSQPILFGGMLMPKFAALSNHTTWKCQRRKGKRCRIPKVKILPVITTNQKSVITTKTKNILFYSSRLLVQYSTLCVQSLQNRTSKLSEKSFTKKLLHDQKKKRKPWKTRHFSLVKLLRFRKIHRERLRDCLNYHATSALAPLALEWRALDIYLQNIFSSIYFL